MNNKILTIDDYNVLKNTFEVDPLLTAWDDSESIIFMPIQVRIEIQERLFQAASHTAMLSKFYRWCWDHKEQICEETGTPLHSYSAKYISHIMSRGAHCEKSFDPRNVNILSPAAHTQWETGDRETMRIYWRNQTTIIRLNNEYNKLKPRRIE